MHSLARTLFTAKLLLLNAVSDTYSADHCADNPGCTGQDHQRWLEIPSPCNQVHVVA